MEASPLARTLWGLFGAVSMLFLLSPIVLVVMFSFGANRLATLPMGGLTFQWYGKLLADPNFWSALQHSLIVTLSVGAISTVIGTLAAMALARWRASAASIAMMTLSLPVMMPPLVLALALATSLSSLGLRFGLHTVIPSHLVFTQPFVILI